MGKAAIATWRFASIASRGRDMSGPSKTRTSFYRRLCVAHLISQGTDTVPPS